jgi:hypothetical protein
MSVISEFDGLMIAFGDGFGAVLAAAGRCKEPKTALEGKESCDRPGAAHKACHVDVSNPLKFFGKF